MSKGSDPIDSDLDFSGLTLGEKADKLLIMSAQMTPAVQRLENSRRLSRIAIGALALNGAITLGLMVGLLFAFHNASVQADRRDTQYACVQTYINRYATVALIRSDANARRTDSLDAWVRAAPDTFPRTAAEIARVEKISAERRKAYLAISDAYQDTLAENPLPPAPSVECLTK